MLIVNGELKSKILYMSEITMIQWNDDWWVAAKKANYLTLNTMKMLECSSVIPSRIYVTICLLYWWYL